VRGNVRRGRSVLVGSVIHSPIAGYLFTSVQARVTRGSGQVFGGSLANRLPSA